jgi:hypothetical protein
MRDSPVALPFSRSGDMPAINLSDLLMLSVNCLGPPCMRCADKEVTLHSKNRLLIFFAAANTSSDRIFCSTLSVASLRVSAGKHPRHAEGGSSFLSASPVSIMLLQRLALRSRISDGQCGKLGGLQEPQGCKKQCHTEQIDPRENARRERHWRHRVKQHSESCKSNCPEMLT